MVVHFIIIRMVTTTFSWLDIGIKVDDTITSTSTVAIITTACCNR